MRIGFIGAGAMASAIIRGALRSGHVKAGEVVAFDPHEAGLAALAHETGITAAASNAEVVDRAEMVILAVKPQVLPAVMAEVGERIADAPPLVVSIAAGTPLDRLEGWLGVDTPIVRAMPNLNIEVGQGMTAVCANAAATKAQVGQVVALFASIGEVIELPEHLIRPFTAIAGSSPAWTFYYIDALARGAVAAGMPKAQALAVAAHAVRGSAALLASGKAHPWALIDQVCSPAGTTIAGLHVLEDHGLAPAVADAVRATISRDEEIAAATDGGQRSERQGA